MARKSDIVRALVAAGEYRSALRIAKGFRLGITKEQSYLMSMGYECMTHPRFYESIGFDIDEVSRKGIETVTRLYGS